jgi:hypothetical protein
MSTARHAIGVPSNIERVLSFANTRFVVRRRARTIVLDIATPTASRLTLIQHATTNTSPLFIEPQTRTWLQTANFSPTLRRNIKKPPLDGGDVYRESKRVRGSRRGVLCLRPRRSSIHGGSFDDRWGRTSQYCKAACVGAVARRAQRRPVRVRLPASNSGDPTPS